MSDTTAVTSDEKLCTKCGAPFGEDDDKRCNDCSACRGVDPKVDVQGVDEPDYKALSIPEVTRGKIPAAPPKDFYWLGVTDDCPWHYVTAGGVCFQRYMGQVVDSGNEGRQEFRDQVHRGSPIQHLTEKHVERILEEVALKVVRHYRIEERELRNGRTVSITSGSLVSMKTEKKGGNPKHPYISHESDRPVGEFLWMVQVRNKSDRPYSDTPPTLVKRP